LTEELDATVLDKHDIMDYTCIYNLYMHIKYVTTKQYTVQSSPSVKLLVVLTIFGDILVLANRHCVLD
jgi:hypothetical protein